MTKPAARVADEVAHILPPVLTGTFGSPDVLIGGRPAWRGISAAQLAQLIEAIKEATKEIKKAELASELAEGSSAAPAAKANEKKVKAGQAKKLADLIKSFMPADIHMCIMILPPPAHGPGVVVGSNSVFINGQPACRVGDEILESNVKANIPPINNRITKGCETVFIGD
ncbi:MAG: hypothetical protein F6K42_34900 [Leptolyngbya sp. SIO1D8]|nr:hypothetical protein [Leptolyngbya sp. SIO1D8]